MLEKKEKKEKFCPKCGSNSLTSDVMSYSYTCNKCKYQAHWHNESWFKNSIILDSSGKAII